MLLRAIALSCAISVVLGAVTVPEPQVATCVLAPTSNNGNIQVNRQFALHFEWRLQLSGRAREFDGTRFPFTWPVWGDPGVIAAPTLLLRLSST